MVCTVHSKRTFKLGIDPTQSVCGSPAGCEGVAHMVLARETVAYESFATEPYNIERIEAVTKEYIVTRNLSTGHVVHRVPNGGDPIRRLGLGRMTAYFFPNPALWQDLVRCVLHGGPRRVASAAGATVRSPLTP
jgi:hypothetical protein